MGMLVYRFGGTRIAYVDMNIAGQVITNDLRSKMKKITREVLKNMMDTNVDFVLIDARGHEAFDKEHLPGAVSIPSDHLGEHLLKNYKKDRTIVTYCSSFECTASTIAAEKLEKYGFRNILEFKGGLADWKGKGYPTEK
jgi:rhodanese-related sulfurtransferase